jgi:molecular chaperone Hsp33
MPGIIMTETHTDLTQRFIFETADIRGEFVNLSHTLLETCRPHAYAPGVRKLLGEMLSATALLTATLKFEGKLILQARGDGQIPLIMAESTHDRKLRAIARGAEQATSENFSELLAHGQLAITIDPHQGKRYQGIVSLQSESLASSLDSYFEQSEQLGTRLWLASDGERTAGLLLQQLPATINKDMASRADQWVNATTLAETLTVEELLSLDADVLLHRLYHEEEVRLFDPSPAQFECSCSRERSFNALASLPTNDLESLLEEQDHITIDCEFCTMQYRFTEADLGELLVHASPTQH